ncbi:MAG TPA: hypothetical protein VN544_00040 [Gaiellaceae bacterium]|jgi:hypothetical protein|nr:hypothetical protein [Gaiellaceae bacterium]
MKKLGLVVTVALFLAPGAGAVAVQSGLHGIVTRGPIAPMCVAEQPCSAPAKNITLLFSRNGQVVARSKTDLAGRYHLRLRPGAYGVALTSTPKAGRGLEPDHVRIRTGRYVRLDFSIDTGIR